MGLASLDMPTNLNKKRKHDTSSTVSTRKIARKTLRQRKRENIYSRNTETVTSVSVKAQQPRTNRPTSYSTSRSNHSQPTLYSRGSNNKDESTAAADGFEDDLGSSDGDTLSKISDSDSGSEQRNDDSTKSADSEPSRAVSQTIKDKLAADDAEIEELERKLGIKKGRKTLPKAFQEDGLDVLLDNLQPEDETEDDDVEKNQKQLEYDEWLASKRAGTSRANPHTESHDQYDQDDDESDIWSTESKVYGDGDESEPEFTSISTQKQRENPYVAPVDNHAVAKYVPPSLRAKIDNTSEKRERLRRNLQGLINRLTETNILSIVQSVEKLYQNNARGELTEVITDAVMAQICSGTALNDQFFVLTGAFAAAIYRIIGASFGSHLLHRLVDELSKLHSQTNGAIVKDEVYTRKEAVNLVGFITQLYVFEAIGSRLIFDYMEVFLQDLTERNVELLLKICRTAGRLLRRDDPRTLKHIASILNAKLAKADAGSVSVRTQFMVETINDLKDNRSKAKGVDSAVVSDHTSRLRKRISELKSHGRRLDGLAAMGVSLADLQNVDTRGQWWLVGASVPAQTKGNGMQENREGAQLNDETKFSDEEDMDFVMPDYSHKARSQGLSSPAQVAIFTALMSASNFESGYMQFIDLKLKKDDQLEISRVIVQCVGSELEYNDYYALVAKLACANSRLRFSFQDRLWKIFRSLGESLFGDDIENEETADSERMRDERRLAQVAQFYAALVANQALTLAILKPLDMRELSGNAANFMEIFLITLLRMLKGTGTTEDMALESAFGAARDIPSLAAGLHWFMRKKLRDTKMVSGAIARKVDRRRKKVQKIIQAASEL